MDDLKVTIEALNKELAKLAKIRQLDRVNLEYEAFEISVTTTGQQVDLTSLTTRQEHKRVLGVFFASTSLTDYLSTIKIEISQKPVISTDYVLFFLHQRTQSLSVSDCAFLTDIPVQTSPVRISYKDARPGFSAYKVYVFLICEK